MNSIYDDLVPTPQPRTTPLENNMKSIFTSKTIWANLIGGAVAVITHLSNSDLVANNPEVAAYFATGMAVLNLLLRLVTKAPVAILGK